MANENSKIQSEPKKAPEPQMTPLAKIHDLPGVVQTKQPDKSYGGLVSSIQASGVKEPVILRKHEDGEYQLVTGYRRRRASELTKKQDIPALVYEMSLKDALEYHAKANIKPDTPVPGKLVEAIKSEEAKKPEKTAEASAKTEEKVEEKPAVQIPAPPAKKEESKDPEKVETPPKEEAKENKDAAKNEQEVKAVPPVADEKKTEKVEEPRPLTSKTEPEALNGPVAKGPAGTAISLVFEERLAPPDEKALKDLPAPKEGESFFIVLHPGYLEKSKFNEFSVDKSSENYRELRKSIELAGIHDPVLTRLKPEGGLEILSGQRRHMVALELNYPVPAIIQKIDDADAKIIVADGNLHRDKISTYDLSRALRMKMEGMKQKAGRRKKGDLTAEALNSDEKLAHEMGMSVSKLNRIIRLSEASKEVCDRVDDGSLALSIASAISFLEPKNQNEVLRLADLGYKVTNERVERMKKAEKTGKMDDRTMRDILEDRDLAPKQVIPPTPPVSPVATPVKVTVPVVTPTLVTPAPQTAETSAVPTPLPQAAPVSAVAHEQSAEKDFDDFKGEQKRPEYTKVVLAGDRLRKYFPDVDMTPREIEESIYEALEERRQRQEKTKQKELIFKKNGLSR